MSKGKKPINFQLEQGDLYNFLQQRAIQQNLFTENGKPKISEVVKKKIEDIYEQGMWDEDFEGTQSLINQTKEEEIRKQVGIDEQKLQLFEYLIKAINQKANEPASYFLNLAKKMQIKDANKKFDSL